MFFKFAAENPNMEFLFWFVLPIKVKWLAILDAAYLLYNVFENIISGLSYLSRGGSPATAGIYFSVALAIVVAEAGKGGGKTEWWSQTPVCRLRENRTG